MLSMRTLSISSRIISKNGTAKGRYASHVAFVGIGQMGFRMANNLIKNGETIKIFDVVSENLQQVKGAQVCRSAQEAAENASAVITMLPNGNIVKEAILGPEGIFKSIPKNALLIDSSTIEPKVAQELAETSQEKGVRFLDAPVSGGVTGAEAATLTFMVGGPEASVKSAEPLLLKMGAKVFHCGGPGAGQIAKLCNNMILGITMIGTSEAINLGTKLGLDPKVLTSIINVSTGRSWSSDSYNPVPGLLPNVPPSNDYKGGFSVKLIAKDLGLAENAAITCDAPVLLGAAAHQVYRALITHGYANKDFASVYQFLKGGYKP